MEHEETRLDPDKVRRVEFFHQPPGRQLVRITVEYTTGELKVHIVVTGRCLRTCSRGSTRRPRESYSPNCAEQYSANFAFWAFSEVRSAPAQHLRRL